MSNNVLPTVENTLNIVFKKAPMDTGNLIYSMKSVPKNFGVVSIIHIGSEWGSKSKTKYNYGQLLNDKRIIKNRETKIKKGGKVSQEQLNKRDKIRVERAASNSRTLIVKDTKYGKTMVISQRQYETNRQRNAKDNQKLRDFQKKKDYEIIRVSYDKPFKKMAPTRVNKHYHYLDNICDIFPKVLAKELNGVLHKGYYEVSQKRTTKKKEITKLTDVLKQIKKE